MKHKLKIFNMRDKLYIGCKIIKAYPMTENDFLVKFKNSENNPSNTKEGYLVIYPDGYHSWSPANVFETSYREIIQSELDLVISTFEYDNESSDC